MHVGLLIYGDINDLSGGYLYDRQLISYLQGQGDTVEIIRLTRGSYISELLSRSIPEAIYNQRLDILIQDELVYPRLFNINTIVKSRLDCPVVSLIHLLDSSRPQMWLRRFFAKRAERRYLHSVDGTILNSENTQRMVCELLNGDLPANVIAVPAADHQTPPVAEAVENTAGNGEHRLKILYVGNVIRQKGLHVLLEALGQLDRGRYKLTVTGRLDMEPAYVERIMGQIKRCGLLEDVQFTGPLKDRDVATRYLENDVLVLPSVNEAYGIVYLEAQRFGLPVIGTLAGGAREIIEHGRNGYLIKPGDSKTLSGYLSTLKDDPELLKIMGINAMYHYQQHPTWDDTCSRIRDFLVNIIQARKSQT